MRIAVFGARGRTGRRVCELARRKHEVFPIEADTPLDDVPQVDVAIDFSVPTATQSVCDFCLQRRVPLVSGVTGRNAEQQAMLENLKNYVRVETSANFSRGVEAMRKTAEIASIMLDDWDTEIIEMHRKGKKDSPSGTALMLAAAVKNKKGAFGRSTVIHSLRCGNHTGTHTVVFAGNGETLTITHTAESSDVFALGAIKKAEEIVKR